MKISIILYQIALLLPIVASSQKRAEFESDFTMTNAQGKTVKFTIGFDKNAFKDYEDTVFGEYNLFRPNRSIFFRDSFDILLHPGNVYSFDRSILQSPKCGEYEYGPLQLIVKVNTYMFPLTLKWNKTEYTGMCVARSCFAPSAMGPLTGDYSDIILLRDLDSLIITHEMAKSIWFHNYSSSRDTIRYMFFLFRPQGASTSDGQNQINPKVNYSKGRFILKNVEHFDKMNVYSLDGRLLNTVRLPSTHLGEITIPWTPPDNAVYIISLTGQRYFNSFKVYCY